MPDEPVNPPVDPPTDPPASAPTVNKDALEVGEILLSSGYTKDQINDLLAAPGTLSQITHALETNPIAVIDGLAQRDPALAKAVHDKLAQAYIDRYDDKSGGGNKDGKPDLAAELKRTNERIDAQERDRQNRDMLANAQVIKQRYDARVDDLLGTLPDTLKLTKSEKESLKAKLNFDINADSAALERVARGNFIDVPKKFKDLADSWSNDRKVAAEEEKKAREGAEKRSFGELPPGASPFSVERSVIDKSLEGNPDDWESSIQEFARTAERYKE